MKSQLNQISALLGVLLLIGCNQLERQDKYKKMNLKNKEVTAENIKIKQDKTKLEQEKQTAIDQLKKLTLESNEKSASLKKTTESFEKANQEIADLKKVNLELAAKQFQIRQYGYFILKNDASVNFHSEKPQITLEEIPGKDAKGKSLENLIITRKETQEKQKDSKDAVKPKSLVTVTKENNDQYSIGCDESDLKVLNLKKENIKKTDLTSLFNKHMMKQSEFDNELTVLKIPRLIVCREVNFEQIDTEKMVIIANELILVNAHFKLNLDYVFSLALRTNELQLVQENSIELPALKLKKQEAYDIRLNLTPTIFVDTQKISNLGSLKLRIAGAEMID